MGSSDQPIGPNPCSACGGEYGEHAEWCWPANKPPPKPLDLLAELSPPGLKLQVKYRTPQTQKMLPLQHAKPGDCGYDLGYAPDPVFEGMTDGVMRIFPHTFKLVPTGVSVKIPDGYFGLLCGRSSTFGKRGLFVVESRIDSGYTGELFVKVWHPAVFGGDFQAPPGPAVIRPWERFAQIVILPYVSPQIEVVSDLPTTERGASGFGSSGGFQRPLGAEKDYE